jgi:glycerol-3-phosphate dehydrogenase
MKVTIVGGGNIGTQFAVHFSEKGHSVTVFTSSPDVFDHTLSIVDENKIVTHKGSIWLRMILKRHSAMLI